MGEEINAENSEGKGDERKALFPCRKCQKNINVSRAEVVASIKETGAFECPHCDIKLTKLADAYTRMLISK